MVRPQDQEEDEEGIRDNRGGGYFALGRRENGRRASMNSREDRKGGPVLVLPRQTVTGKGTGGCSGTTIFSLGKTVQTMV